MFNLLAWLSQQQGGLGSPSLGAGSSGSPGLLNIMGWCQDHPWFSCASRSSFSAGSLLGNGSHHLDMKPMQTPCGQGKESHLQNHLCFLLVLFTVQSIFVMRRAFGNSSGTSQQHPPQVSSCFWLSVSILQSCPLGRCPGTVLPPSPGDSQGWGPHV